MIFAIAVFLNNFRFSKVKPRGRRLWSTIPLRHDPARQAADVPRDNESHGIPRPSPHIIHKPETVADLEMSRCSRIHLTARSLRSRERLNREAEGRVHIERFEKSSGPSVY
jgi:hypothetical protein